MHTLPVIHAQVSLLHCYVTTNMMMIPVCCHCLFCFLTLQQLYNAKKWKQMISFFLLIVNSGLHLFVIVFLTFWHFQTTGRQFVPKVQVSFNCSHAHKLHVLPVSSGIIKKAKYDRLAVSVINLGIFCLLLSYKPYINFRKGSAGQHTTDHVTGLQVMCM